MQVIYERCAAVDVGKDVIAVAVIDVLREAQIGAAVIPMSEVTGYGLLGGGSVVWRWFGWRGAKLLWNCNESQLQRGLQPNTLHLPTPFSHRPPWE